MSARPLEGRRVLLTRPEARGHGLAARLRVLGAVVEEHPTIVFEPLLDTAEVAAALRALERFAAVFFTSPTGVTCFAAAHARHVPERPLALTAAAVGSATARALAAAGIPPAVVGDEPNAAGLGEAARRLGLAGREVLVVRPEVSPGRLEEALAAAGAAVRAVAFYRTAPAPTRVDAARALAASPIDAVVFASPSALLALLGTDEVPRASVREALLRTRRVAIGPTTSEALASEGFPATSVAEAPTDEAVAQAVVRALQSPRTVC